MFCRADNLILSQYFLRVKHPQTSFLNEPYQPCLCGGAGGLGEHITCDLRHPLVSCGWKFLKKLWNNKGCVLCHRATKGV